MLSLAPRPTEEYSERRSRIQGVAIGRRLALALATAAVAYTAATWEEPHRATIIVLIVAASAWAFAPLLVGIERLVHSARSDVLSVIWSAGCIALIAGLSAADGGARSPFALLFILPLVFAALCYPLPSVVAVGTLDVVTFVVTAMLAGNASHAHIAFFATVIAATAVLCAWAAMDQQRRRAALARVSRTDPLTGCLNRRGFEERLEAELDSATRHHRSLALVVLDLDHFKAVNDTHGHAAGDELLRWTVIRAADTLRPMDSVGRLGGDEFAILIPGAGASEAREVAARLLDALAERVEVSVGVAAFPLDGTDRESLHRCADADLYAAKHSRQEATDVSFASAFASAVSLRMTVPDEHSSAVPHYALAIARQLGFGDQETEMLRLAAILHDVGKVSVPDRILRKPGPLTLDEFELVKGHSAAGADIVAHIDGLSPVAEWIRHSHEHFDGSGYPHRLRGEEIPLASRILLVADAFDAMTSHRPYGVRLAPEAALAELRRAAGRQFDLHCVEALAEHLEENPVDLRVRRFSRLTVAPAA